MASCRNPSSLQIQQFLSLLSSRGLAVAACPWLKLHQIRQKTDPPLLQHWHPKAYLAGCFCGWLISLFTPLSMLLDDSPWPCFVSSC